MKSLCPPRLIRLLISAVLAASPVRPALAADFQVNPVRLNLNNKIRTALLAVQNHSPEPVRVQVSVVQWAQDSRGRMELTPTRDFSFFPSLMTVEPGQSRNIRVGGVVSAGESEKTYRVLVEQLPSPVPMVEGSVQIRVLTRMSIPLFVAPVAETTRGRIEQLELVGGKVSFSLRNAGTLHVLADKARVRGLDSDGRTVLDKEQAGWYILAGGERQFSLEVPAGLCSHLKTVSVEVHTDSGTFPATTAVSSDRCTL